MSAPGFWIWERVRGVNLRSGVTSAELINKVRNALGRHVKDNENVLETMDDLAEKVIELRTIISDMEDQKPRKVKVVFGDPEEEPEEDNIFRIISGRIFGQGQNPPPVFGPPGGPGPGAAGSMQQIGRVEKVKEESHGVEVIMRVTDSDMIDALRMGRAELSIMNRLAQRRKG